MRALSGALLALLCFVGAARAQSTTGGLQNGGISYTLATTAAFYVGANANRTAIVIDNPSATIDIACAFGQAAALNTGGSFMIPHGFMRSWPFVVDGPAPTGAISCISASGTPTITILTVP